VWAEEALVAARAVEDVSLEITALAALSSYQPDLGGARALVAEAETLFEKLPARGSAIPAWLVRHYWFVAAEVANYLPGDQLIAWWRELVATSTGPARLSSQWELAVMLFSLGRLSEAASAIEDYGILFESSGDERSALAVVNPAFPHHLSALIALELSDADAAMESIRAMRATMPAGELPELAGQAQLLEGAVERMRGRAASAEALLKPLASHEVQSVRSLARWLLAVLYREAGQPERARDSLRECWNALPWTALGEDLVRPVLLERAVQTQETDPVTAAHLVALALRNRARYVPTYGVTYDPDDLLATLRRRLGDDVVARAVAAPGTEAIPIEWDRLPQ
jgi:hypothetical protein